MASYKFGFIGAGNMGGALAKAVCKKCANEVLICDADSKKADLLATNLGCKSAESAEVAKSAEYIFLGVKPQVMSTALNDIADILRERTDRFILVTMAAGMKISSFNDMLGKKYPIIRIMPNTPVSVGKGMILYSASDSVTEDELKEFCASLEFAGRLDNIDESLIDAACAISGCGPAFVYLFAQAMADAGVECGLEKNKALEYASQTLSGAAELLLTSGKEPKQLTDEVCSPGGSTIEGVKVIQSSAFNEITNKAIKASFEKTKLLGK